MKPKSEGTHKTDLYILCHVYRAFSDTIVRSKVFSKSAPVIGLNGIYSHM